jgi:hypothetical protein
VRKKLVDRYPVSGFRWIFRQILGDGIVQVQLSLLFQLKDRSGREGLGHRPNQEPGGGRVGGVGGDIGQADSLFEHDIAVFGREHRTLKVPILVGGVQISLEGGRRILVKLGKRK